LSPKVVKELQDINDSWAGLKKLAISLLSITPEQKMGGYEKLVMAGEDLSKKIDNLVEDHKSISDKKFDKIFLIQVTVITISLIFTILMLIYFTKTFLRKIFQSFGDIEDFTKDLSSQSESIHKCSNIVNSNSKDLAQSMEETMSAITELTQITRLNEENTEKSRISSNSCSTQATYGKEVVDMLMKSIQLINEANRKLSVQIEQGNHEFKKILELVNGISSETSIINDIVFQTKLLSFNASVEAARAGESGKGFSVVAEEVGSLAVMSGNSAQKISGILQHSQKTIEEIITNNASKTEVILKECQSKVEQGLGFAKKCGESFESIYHDVQNVDSIIKQLASSSKEQTSGINMINNSMMNVNSACRQNEISAHEMMGTVQEMVSCTQTFQQQISEFSFILLGQETKQKPVVTGTESSEAVTLA
jgi:methyl-accepting chemotaxis protein